MSLVGCACGCSCERGGDIYSIPTTYSTQSKEDTGNVSKGGGIKQLVVIPYFTYFNLKSGGKRKDLSKITTLLLFSVSNKVTNVGLSNLIFS